MKVIDDAYMGKSSRRSLEQTRRCENGETSNRHLFLKNFNEYAWKFCQDYSLTFNFSKIKRLQKIRNMT